MPELPEVESLRRSLEPLVLGRRVLHATPPRKALHVRPASGPARLTPADLLEGLTITATARRGKQLALLTSAGAALVVHLGMSGQLLHLAPGVKIPSPRTQPGKHLHARWALDDGSLLLFRDPRRFGGLVPFPSRGALDAHWSGTLGPDALTITDDELLARLGSVRAIKALLLDQSVLAGVGNIYADESLHRARIHPATPADRLTPAQARALAGALRSVLAQAVDLRGSTLRDYRSAQGEPGSATALHLVYGRADQPCLACGTPIASAPLAQRTTAWCPRCQPQP
ncbi:MAG: bifunctional DNA-formamidopyrimidine glycosylase/DNA-(apurinic or apyrimidinic site) lyase [Planctomycetota bacterium]|nr:bifunctional DNA-formamidopyrimidine glycosylase/DNA-(apurinic or apyrimidinic site) lyase [Planctomycetota bacterium]